jgi:hypothetical protein
VVTSTSVMARHNRAGESDVTGASKFSLHVRGRCIGSDAS